MVRCEDHRVVAAPDSRIGAVLLIQIEGHGVECVQRVHAATALEARAAGTCE
jgi:hypothetical protein